MEKVHRDGNAMQKLYAEAFVVRDELGWFIPAEYNALFQVELGTGECTYLGWIPDEEKCGKTLYVAIARKDECLIMAPFMANEIALYDLEQQIFEKIPLKNYGDKYNDEKFSDVVCYGNTVFFIPMNYPAIVRLDLESRELSYFEKDIRLLKEMSSGTKYIFNIKPVVRGDILWLGCFGVNGLVEFDMKTLEMKMHRLESCIGGTSGVCYDGERFWMVQYPNNRIISWNPMTKEEDVYEQYPEKFVGKGYMFSHILCENERIRLLPQSANMIVELDVESGLMYGKKRVDIDKVGSLSYWTYFCNKDQIFYVTQRGQIVRLNHQLEEELVSVLRLREEDIDRIKRDLLNLDDEICAKALAGIALKESRFGESLLENYINAVMQDMPENKTAKPCGEQVYRSLIAWDE